jgi:alpha-methylacyl-CoA racemase
MGPLTGISVVEVTGLGPAPFCAMMLGDMGADVVRIDRPGRPEARGPRDELLVRNRKRTVTLDLKAPAGVAAALELIGDADALIEGFRPGVMERLGLGPDVCAARNPRLVYGRMTGYGQDGPLSAEAGHDINYIALSGALHAIGTSDAGPVIPLNLIGDFGGGGMLLAFGIVCALLEARRSGRGQVVDAAMTDGAALLMAMTYALKDGGEWTNRRADNLLDGGAPHYNVYRCADDKWLALGALEPQFYAALLDGLGIDDPAFRPLPPRSSWSALRARIAGVVMTRTRDEWCAAFAGTDACVGPVLDLDEAPLHPHNAARETFVRRDGVTQPAPAPAPRFSPLPPRELR